MPKREYEGPGSEWMIEMSATNGCRRREAGQWVIGCVWLASVLGSMAVLIDYTNQSGDPGSPPQAWPEQAHLDHSHESDTLVLFAHPLCPCTSASIAELARLIAEAPNPILTHVVFFAPDEHSWPQTQLEKKATRIPDVIVHRDPEGVESRIFGVSTSGHVLLYGADGHLRYSGGITGGRGHEGANTGRTSVLACIRERSTAPPFPIFGCGLRELEEVEATR